MSHVSEALRQGLHLVLATLVLDPEGTPDGAWWERLPGDVSLRSRARDGQLTLAEYAELHGHPFVRAALERTLATLGIPLPAPEASARLFREALSRAGPPGGRTQGGALWEALCAPVVGAMARRYHPLSGAPLRSRHMARPSPRAREALEALLAFDTGPEGADHPRCVSWLRERLETLGFTCRLHQPAHTAPALLEAHRPGQGLLGHVVMYGHYDVMPPRSAARGGGPPDDVLVEEDGRWFSRGVGDNKGPLAARLAALAELEQAPALTWFIQGEEETGSAVASEVLGERLPGLEAGLWLDETGYHDHEDGTLRLIACERSPDAQAHAPPGEAMRELLDALRLLAGRWGIGTRLEVRRLNKAEVRGGCPFHRNLPAGARYLALGVNDSRSGIHGAKESVPLWTFPLHAEQLQVVFHWVDRQARGPS
jgi:hypothetical protein